MRNATPKAVKIQATTSATPGYILQNVRFLENDHFQCRSSVAESDAQTHTRIEPIFLHLTKHKVAVRFVWSWRHCGAPERNSHNVFQLVYGEWGRFACNGRFGAQSSSGCAWEYHKTIFNIALTEYFDEDLFIGTDPVVDDSRLALLK